MKIVTLTPEFVEFVPPKLENGTLYVSMIYGTAVHQCCCGCGEKVVTPLSPTDWKLTYDGETVSLHPSIGNWNFACQSHYWVQNNHIRWAEHWSKEKIQAGRVQDAMRKHVQFEMKDSLARDAISAEAPKSSSILSKLKKFLS